MFKRTPRPSRWQALDFANEWVKPTRARRVQEELTSEGIAFLAQMAGKIALAHTSEEFPDVINKLALHRHLPAFMVLAIVGLKNELQKRNELSSHVVAELGRLQDLYCDSLDRPPTGMR